MLDKVKNFLLHSSSTNYIGEELFSIVEGQGYQKLFDQTEGKYNYSEKGILISIYSLYLFSYFVATQKNAYNLSNQTLESITYYYKLDLYNKFENKYKSDKNQKEVFCLLENKTKEYIKLYNQEYKNISKKVVATAVRYLLNTEEDEEDNKNKNQYQDLVIIVMDLIYNTITIIQDYLIDLSLKRFIHI